jgi:hypothetical protein
LEKDDNRLSPTEPRSLQAADPLARAVIGPQPDSEAARSDRRADYLIATQCAVRVIEGRAFAGPSGNSGCLPLLRH